MPPDLDIPKLQNPHSYRGYYNQLSFEPDREASQTVEETLKLCESLVGNVYIGWKGGEYEMGLDTELNYALEGQTGFQILDLTPDGQFVFGLRTL